MITKIIITICCDFQRYIWENMSGRRGNGDPFSQFGGDLFAGFGGFGGHRSLTSSFFGGRDPFDDPFFTRPFGGMLGPMMNADPFYMGSHMMNSHQSGFSTQGPLMNAHQSPGAYRSNGPIIEEINSDNEVVDDEEKKRTPKKHCRSSEGPSEVEGEVHSLILMFCQYVTSRYVDVVIEFCLNFLFWYCRGTW